MAADFNLSAEISLQLAQGAAAALRKDIEKGVVLAGIKIDPQASKEEIKKAIRSAKPVAIPISFKVADRATQEAAVKRAIGKIPVEVKFDRKSVTDNINSAKLKTAMGNRTLKVKVEAVYDKAVTKKLKDLEKFVKQANKEAGKLQSSILDIGDIDINTDDLQEMGKEASDSSRKLDELISRINKLSRSGKKQFGGGKFFTDSRREIKLLLAEMDKLSDGNGFDLIEKKFRGLDNNSAKNLESSLKTIFKAYSDLDTQSKKLDAAQARSPKKNFGVERKALEDARAAVGKFFRELDSADPQTFAIAVTSVMREVGQVTREALIAAQRDILRFDALISNLNQKKAGINTSAGRGVTKSAIDDLIKYVELRQQAGDTKEQVIASPRFQELNALLDELKYVDQAAKRATSSLDTLLYKSKTTELGSTLGGRNTGYTKKVADITAKAQGKTDGTIESKKIEEYRSKAAQDISNLQTRSEKLNATFGRIIDKYSQFKADGFKGAATAVRKLGFEIFRLAKAGSSLESLNQLTTTGLAQINSLKALDAKVQTSIGQIQKLRNALEFSPVADIAGAKPALEKLDSNLKSRTGQFSGLTQDNLNKELSKGLLDIRGLQRFNEASDTTVTKLNNISNSFEDLSKVDVYSGYINKFEAGAKKIAASSDTVGQKLQQLKKLSDNVLIGAKLDSEGGFFGSIARSAGLATKRLAAFLVLAQGLYSIQGALSASFGEAIKVDKEFTRLEQVFNKDLTGSNLVKSLRFTTLQIKELGRTLGISTLEVANAAQILAQAGIYGRDLEKLLDTISKSQLGPSFGSAAETAEATIAIMRQFNLTAEDTQEALGGINRLSAKYAVEAKGITEAVRRAGGVFSASGDDIASFAAAFTLVKQKTREADEAIATGLRNVAQRLQRTGTQTKLKAALGIELVENGEFVGFEESIKRIGKELEKYSTQSSKFAQVREIIGGARQGARATPLLQDYEEFDKFTKEFQKGAKSIEEDVSVAFQSIENKIARATSAVTDLFHEIISSDFAKFLVDGFTSITLFATSLLKTLNSIPGAILAIGATAKILGKGKFVGQAFLSHFAPRKPVGFNRGGGPGLVPGNGPNKDSVLAMLTPREFVMQRSAVEDNGLPFMMALNSGAIKASNLIVKRNKGGIIPGFNTGGLNTGSGVGTSSLFDGFFNFIKKVIGLGDAVEKTAQEIQTGLNLPELFDRAIKPRSEPINIDIASILKDQAKTNIDAIRKAGAFVEGRGTSGDKFLPKPGTPELPSSIMDKIIEDALKTPAKTRLPVQPYKGNAADLRNLSKDAGIDIPKKLFTQLFKGVKIIGEGEPGLKEGLAASFNKRTKQATFTDKSVFSSKTVAHEIGHGLEVVVTGKLKSIADALGKSGTGERTRQRLIRSGAYGKENSAEFNKKLNSELIADIFKEATAVKSGKGKNISSENKSLLNLFSTVLKKQTGITITGRSKNNDTAIGLSGVLDNLKQTDTERALGAGVRLPGSLNKPLNKASQAIIDNRNNAEIRGSSSSGNFQSIIQAIRQQGAFKGESSRSRGTPYAYSKDSFLKRGLARVGGGISNAVSYKGIGGGSLATATKGLSSGFSVLTKSLVTTRGGLVGLAGAAFTLSSLFGGLESGFVELIAAMGTAAFSMYTLSKIASISQYTKEAAGVGVKNLAVAKAKSIGAAFKESKGHVTNPNREFFAPGPRAGLSALSIEGVRSSARKSAQSSGDRGLKTASILANIRATKPTGVVKSAKSAEALANIAAAKTPSGILSKGLTSLSTSTFALGKTFNILAVASGLVVGALTFFVSSLEDSAKEGKEKAKTAEEARIAGAKGRLGEALGSPVKALGAAASGAVVGASLGSFVAPLLGPFGPLAPIIGGLAGGLIGLLIAFKDDLFGAIEGAFPILDGFGESVTNSITNLQKRISDGIYVDYKNITSKKTDPGDRARSVGNVAGKSRGLAGFGAVGLGLAAAGTAVEFGSKAYARLRYGKKSGQSLGEKRLALEEQKDTLDFNVGKIKRDFAGGYGERQNLLNVNPNQRQDLLAKGKIASGSLDTIKERYKKGDVKGKFSDATDEEKSTVTKELQDIADVYKTASPKNRKIIIDTYKQNGIDIVEMSKEVGVVLDEAKDDMAAAFDELSLFFVKMKNVTELSSARISGLEGALQVFADPSKISSDLPDQYFDILKQGISPASLGFGDIFNDGADKALGLAGDLDPRLLANANFEVQGRRAARNTATSIIAAAPTLKRTTDSDITGFLTDAFNVSNGGNEDLNAAFLKFVESKGEAASSDLVSKDGEINGNKINDLFKEFADTLDTGALDEIKRLNNLNKQYVDQYKSHLAARFALENQSIALLQDNVNKRKTLGDIDNKSKGLVGDKLAEAKGRQARKADSDRLGLTLQGTGLGGNASVAQLQAALLASQQRGRNAGELAKQGGGSQADIAGRKAEIEAGAEEEQNRLRAGLQLIASGTDTAAHAMEEFERASNKAAASSKFLTDALLGSDDQMNQTILGIQAMAAVQQAFDKGGVGAARQELSRFGESGRQAFAAYSGQNEDNQARANELLGITSNITAGPQANDVKDQINNQTAANDALSVALKDNATAMAGNTDKMREMFESQFKNTQQIVQQAEATSKALVDKIANLPDVIKHDMNMVIKIEGGGQFQGLEPAVRKWTEELISARFDDLVKNNNGLNKP